LVIVAGETNLLRLSMSIFAMRADDVQLAAIDRLHHATTSAEVTAKVEGNRAEVGAGCHAGPGPPRVDIVTL
jgi:hypothetical protein